MLLERAEELLGAGCWLPLEAELSALGASGGLGAPAAARLLDGLAATPMGGGEHEFDDGASPSPGSAPRRAGSPVLQARGLQVGRRTRSGSAPVLDDVDLALHPGEVVALLGRNGAGKSSLLMTLARLLPPLAGTVEGVRAALAFQDAEHQFVAHTVRAELAHGLPPGPQSTARVDRLLAEHHLEHLVEQSPFRLSGGERRRVGIAALLAHDRPCLLLDEPTHGLDRRDAVAVAGAVRAAARERALVLATHDLRLAATLASRVLVLGDGRVLADGPAAEVLSDATVLQRGGLRLPALVRHLLERGLPLRRVLSHLDARVPA